MADQFEPGARARRGREITPGPGQSKNKIGWMYKVPPQRSELPQSNTMGQRAGQARKPVPMSPAPRTKGSYGKNAAPANPVVHDLLRAAQANGGFKKNGPTSGSVPMKPRPLPNAKSARPIRGQAKGFSG